MLNQSPLLYSAVTVMPALVINVAVDTAFLYSQTSGPYAGIGVYMMDNNAAGGSKYEGSTNLYTTIYANQGIAFNAFPIDTASSSGDIVQIMGFEIVDGQNIFGNWGYPQQQPSSSPYQWLGTAMVQGTCHYYIKIGVSINGAPLQYYWWGSPSIQCFG